MGKELELRGIEHVIRPSARRLRHGFYLLRHECRRGMFSGHHGCPGLQSFRLKRRGSGRRQHAAEWRVDYARPRLAVSRLRQGAMPHFRPSEHH